MKHVTMSLDILFVLSIMDLVYFADGMVLSGHTGIILQFRDYLFTD